MKQIHKVSSKVSGGLLGGYCRNPQKVCLLPCPLFSVLGSFPNWFILPTHSQICLGLTLHVLCSTDKPVHVADAGTGLPAVSPAGGRDP